MSTDGDAVPATSRSVASAATAKKARRRWPKIAGLVTLALVVGTGIAASIPLVLMERTRSDAVTCLARIDRPRGPKLPDCSEGIDKFSRLARYSYTHHDATYRAEELWSRIMIGEYENASVGSPDPDLRQQTAKFVDDAQTVVEKGSQRIQLDELGPAISAPHLGKMASSLGDRATLIEHFDWWGLWTVRVHALQAALIEGDLKKAEEMAGRYADWDPRDADLRTYIGGVLCLGKDPGKGLELLARIPGDRADKRYAGIARNYGEVLGMMDACAKKAGVDVPTPPQVQHAGTADVEVARTVGEIRRSKLAAVTKEFSDKAVGWLQDDRGLDGDEPWARAILLAAIVAYDERAGDAKGPLSASVLANASKPRASAERLAPALPLVPDDIVNEGPGLRPMLPGRTLSAAAAKLAKMSDGSPAQKTALAMVASAVGVHAALELARSGDAEGAVVEIDKAGSTSGATAGEIDVSAASLYYVAGDPTHALERADRAASDLKVKSSAGFVAALALLSLGRHDEARERVKKLVSEDLTGVDARVERNLRWLELGLADVSEAHAGPIPMPLYTGMSDPSERWRTMGAPSLEADLASWKMAMAAPDDQRLAFRYALMKKRGDAPAFPVPWLMAAARLAPQNARGPSIEVWLDALSGEDAPRMPLSAYVFARLEAARGRGDADTANLWKKKLDALRAVKASEPDLEIARFLGI